MTKKIYLLSISFLILLSCSSEDSKTKLSIGQNYQGGAIFYIDATGEHGLIVSYSHFETKWGCQSNLISGAKGSDKGTGSQNTIDIITGCSEVGIAARICADLVDGGYSDWYLPSRSELSYLHLKKVSLTNIFLPNDNFWSSTQYDNSSAYYQFFGGNPGAVSPSVGNKNSVYHVCPIRSF